MKEINQALLDKGFTLFEVRHGSSPKYMIPDAVADVRRAVRFIRLNASKYGVDPDRMGVWGQSAGGHLSLLLGLASDTGDAANEDEVLRVSNKVAAVVAYYPPVDMEPSAQAVATERPSTRFPALNFDAKEIAAMSPIKHVSADDPPTLLFHGDKDPLVPMRNSEQISAAFKTAGVKTNFIVVPNGVHGFKDDDAKRTTAAMVDWFTKYLSTTPATR
jgi:acetyl esterase/lipase